MNQFSTNYFHTRISEAFNDLPVLKISILGPPSISLPSHPNQTPDTAGMFLERGRLTVWDGPFFLFFNESIGHAQVRFLSDQTLLQSDRWLHWRLETFIKSCANGLWGMRGAILLHGAVAMAPCGNLVGILGASGSGKSTIAAQLHAQGWDVLSDDAIILDPLTQMLLYSQRSIMLRHPSLALLNLKSESEDPNQNTEEKITLCTGRPCTIPTAALGRLKVIVEIERSHETFHVSVPSKIESLQGLIRNTAIAPAKTGISNAKFMEGRCDIIEAIPYFLVNYPRCPENLTRLKNFIDDSIADKRALKPPIEPSSLLALQ